MLAHTIMLIQPNPNAETRTYSDYESVNECIEGIFRIYENHLHQMNSDMHINYDICQLFDFIDQLADLSCLVYQKGTNSYAPFGKDWIKEKVFIHYKERSGEFDP